MGLLLFYGLISIVFSFLCSILEAVLLSVTPTFMSVSAKENASFAPGLKALKDDVDKPLIAILTLNTLAHTVGAILVGVQSEVAFHGAPPLVIPFLNITVPWVGIISALMTVLILVVSEIIPKTIGATYWKSLAGFSTRTLNFMVLAMKYTGLLWVLQLITKLFGHSEHNVLSRADYSTMTDMASEEGVLKEGESKIIKNMLRFEQILVSEHYTPRAVAEMASQDTVIQEYYVSKNKKFPFSRIPVYEGTNQDKITGYVLKDDMLALIADGQGNKTFKDITRDIIFVNAELKLPQLLNKLMTKDKLGKNKHIAMVTDKFGQVEGVITLEDVMETLLGTEIVDEHDTAPDMRILAEENWAKRSKDLDVN